MARHFLDTFWPLVDRARPGSDRRLAVRLVHRRRCRVRYSCRRRRLPDGRAGLSGRCGGDAGNDDPEHSRHLRRRRHTHPDRRNRRASQPRACRPLERDRRLGDKPAETTSHRRLFKGGQYQLDGHLLYGYLGHDDAAVLARHDAPGSGDRNLAASPHERPADRRRTARIVTRHPRRRFRPAVHRAHGVRLHQLRCQFLRVCRRRYPAIDADRHGHMG